MDREWTLDSDAQCHLAFWDRKILLGDRWVVDFEVQYNLGRTLSRDVLLCFLSEVPVTNWAAQ